MNRNRPIAHRGRRVRRHLRAITRWFLLIALITSCAIAFPTRSSAQTEVVISDDLACEECEIELTPITTLGKFEDDVALSRTSQFAVDPVGRHIYAALTYLPGAIVEYDWNGNLVGTFGRVGGGPGEFGSSPLRFALLLGSANRVHVLDSGRRTVIAAGLSSLIGTHPVRHVFEYAAVLTEDRLLLSSSGLSSAAQGPQFTVLDSLGAEVQRFGSAATDSDPVGVIPAPDGGFWAPHLHAYRLDYYTRDGSLERIIRRDVSWFPALDRENSGAPFSEPTFARAWVDEQGRLWTVIRVPDADRARAEAVLAETMRMDRLDFDAVQDTRIEVIEPTTGTLLASTLFDKVLVLAHNGFVVHRGETPEGLVQASISALSLITTQEGS